MAPRKSSAPVRKRAAPRRSNRATAATRNAAQRRQAGVRMKEAASPEVKRERDSDDEMINKDDDEEEGGSLAQDMHCMSDDEREDDCPKSSSPTRKRKNDRSSRTLQLGRRQVQVVMPSRKGRSTGRLQAVSSGKGRGDKRMERVEEDGSDEEEREEVGDNDSMADFIDDEAVESDIDGTGVDDEERVQDEDEDVDPEDGSGEEGGDEDGVGNGEDVMEDIRYHVDAEEERNRERSARTGHRSGGQASSKGKTKRSRVEDSDAEDIAAPAKKRIAAVGYDTSKKIMLDRRGGGSSGNKASSSRGKTVSRPSQHGSMDDAIKALEAAGIDISAIKGALKMYMEDESSQTRPAKVSAEASKKGKQAEKAARPKAGSPSAENGEEATDDYELHPSMRGCLITSVDKMDEPLRYTFVNLPKLGACKLIFKKDLSTTTLNAMWAHLDKSFPDGISASRMCSMVTFKAHPGAALSNPARDDPKRHRAIPREGGNGLVGQIGGKGDTTTTLQVYFGYNQENNVQDGRTYTNNKGITKSVKEVEIALLTGEAERSFGFISAVFGGRAHIVPVSENGGIVFSTKHTVQSDGSTVSTLPNKFKPNVNNKKGARMVHPDIQRRSRDASEIVPVWDCTKHFLNPDKASDKLFHPYEILTQTGPQPDPTWAGDIPYGAFVAVLGTLSSYGAKADDKTLSFNLAAVHILALPGGE